MLSMRILPILMLVAPTPVFAKCHHDPVAFTFAGNPTSTTSASADSGSVCKWHFQNGARGGGVDSITVASAPRHDSASATGESVDYNVIYKSASGYRGSDQFSFAIKGADARGPGTATVVVNIDIH